MISIQPLTEADLPATKELTRWAKLSLTINRILWNDWPNEEAQMKMSGHAIDSSFKDPNIKNLKAVDDATGELLGSIVLTPRPASKTPAAPTPKPEGDTTKPPPPPVPELNAAVIHMVMTTIDGIQRDMADTDYIELTWLVVKQGRRNQGIGRQLVEAAFDHARSANLPLFMTSEPAPRGFFARLGFRETKHADMDLSLHAPPYTGFGLFRLTGMIWEPSG